MSVIIELSKDSLPLISGDYCIKRMKDESIYFNYREILNYIRNKLIDLGIKDIQSFGIDHETFDELILKDARNLSFIQVMLICNALNITLEVIDNEGK